MSKPSLLFHEWSATALGLLPEGDSFPTDLEGTLWAGSFDDAEILLMETYNEGTGVRLQKMKIVQQQPNGGQWTRHIDFTKDTIVSRSSPRTKSTVPDTTQKAKQAAAARASARSPKAVKVDGPMTQTPAKRKGKKKGKKRDKSSEFYWFGACTGVQGIPTPAHHLDPDQIKDYDVVRTTKSTAIGD